MASDHQSPIFICIPGAFCPGSYYTKLCDLLKRHGHEAIYVDLPTMDPALKAGGKLPSMHDDGDHVGAICKSYLDQGQDVILVGNSYGGAVLYETCLGNLPKDRHSGAGQLKHLILLDSFFMPPGVSVNDLLAGKDVVAGTNEIQEMEDKPSVWLPPAPPMEAAEVLCATLPKEEKLRIGSEQQEMCSAAFSVPLRCAGWQHVPSTMVIGGKDNAVPPKALVANFDQALQDGFAVEKVYLENGCHCPMLSDVEDTAKICLDIVSRYT